MTEVELAAALPEDYVFMVHSEEERELLMETFPFANIAISDKVDAGSCEIVSLRNYLKGW